VQFPRVLAHQRLIPSMPGETSMQSLSRAMIAGIVGNFNEVDFSRRCD
jgi:hypothetical protein